MIGKCKTLKNMNLRLARRGRGRGFTMIELLVVIGVLIILAAIVLVGMRSVTGRSREQATRLTLQQLRNLLGEYDAATRLGKGPPNWWWSNGNSLVNVPATDGDFWRAPFVPGAAALFQPLDAPGNVLTGTGTILDPMNPARNGSRAILNTQQAMRYILTVPVNRQAAQQLQSDTLFTPAWQAANIPFTGPDRVYYTQDDPPASAPVQYLVGARVQHEGKFYRCRANHPSPPGTPAPPNANWVEEGTAADTFREEPPIMLVDAWNNPILFVPATGMIVRTLNGETELDPTKRGQTVVVVSPEGSAAAAVLPNQAGELVRAGKPFFVSAGPDGDFTTGDDNIYSFE